VGARRRQVVMRVDHALGELARVDGRVLLLELLDLVPGGVAQEAIDIRGSARTGAGHAEDGT